MNASRMAGPSCRAARQAEYQDKLYTNISLLTMLHEPSSEFLAVFRKDMFARSNKAAFLHVVHYLLTVLNPEAVKEKLITWPTANIVKRENKFRAEVLQYLNELNKIYENADLPVMMSSHLIAPGGQRFIYFMYKLSQLILYEEMKRQYPDEVLSKPESSKDEELNEKVCEGLTERLRDLKSDITDIIDNFNEKFITFKKEADEIIQEKHEINQKLKETVCNTEIEVGKLEKKKLAEEEVKQKFQVLEEKSRTIERFSHVHTVCTKLLSNVQKENTDGEQLDLGESLKVLSINLRRQLSELPDHEMSELEMSIQKLQKRKGELGNAEKYLKMKEEKLAETLKKSEDVVKAVIEDLKD